MNFYKCPLIGNFPIYYYVGPMIFCHDNDDCVGTESCEIDTTQNRIYDNGKSYSIDMNINQYEALIAHFDPIIIFTSVFSLITSRISNKQNIFSRKLCSETDSRRTRHNAQGCIRQLLQVEIPE